MKSPEEKMNFLSIRHKELNMAGAVWIRGRMVGNEGRRGGRTRYCRALVPKENGCEFYCKEILQVLELGSGLLIITF